MTRCCQKCGAGIGNRNQWGHCAGCLKACFGIEVKSNGRVGSLSHAENRAFREQFRLEHNIAAALDVLAPAAASYLDLFKKPAPRKRERAERACLCCARRFCSDGPHNRVCGGCKNSAAWESGDIGDYSIGAQRGAAGGAG